MRKYLILSSCLLALCISASQAREGVKQDKAKKWDPVKAMDANNDGNVTRQEFMQASEARFAKLDANNDGTISKDEREMFANKRKARKGKTGDTTFP